MAARRTLTCLPLTLIVLLAAGLPLSGRAQAPAKPQAASAPLTAPLPMDPEVTSGRFPNGLRYFIRVNKEPANRAELRLAVNAGSILEDDDQLGLAHVVEHMAFNGTRNFPKQELIRFLESTGMRFGPSINAFTSFDETVYMLQIRPTRRTCWREPSSSSRTGPMASRSIPSRSTRSAASSSRNGGPAWAPARGFRNSSCPSS